MTREIQLSQGKVALVDDADFDWLNQWRWYALRRHVNGADYWHAVRMSRRDEPGGRRPIYMHRVILPCSHGETPDHENCDGLDNRRGNLRGATSSQQGANTRVPSNNTSGFKGVSFDRLTGRWRVVVKKDRRSVWCGRFDDAVSAAVAYDDKARELFGDYARLNFAS